MLFFRKKNPIQHRLLGRAWQPFLWAHPIFIYISIWRCWIETLFSPSPAATHCLPSLGFLAPPNSSPNMVSPSFIVSDLNMFCLCSHLLFSYVYLLEKTCYKDRRSCCNFFFLILRYILLLYFVAAFRIRMKGRNFLFFCDDDAIYWVVFWFSVTTMEFSFYICCCVSLIWAATFDE